MPWRAGSTYDSGSTTVLTVPLTVPAAVQAGDVGLILVTWVGAVGETPPTCTAPGWATVVAPVTANNMCASVLGRRYQAGDGSAVTVTLGSGRFVTAVAGWWSGMSGVDVAGVVGTRGGVSQATTTAPGLAASAAGETIVGAWAERTTATGTTVGLSAGTVRVYLEGSGSSTCTACLSDRVAAGTSVDPVIATYSSASGNGAGVQVGLSSTVVDVPGRLAAGDRPTAALSAAIRPASALAAGVTRPGGPA